MELLLGLGLQVLKKYWLYILAAIVIAALWGTYEYRGHEVKVLKAEVIQLKADLKKEKGDHLADIGIWQKQVKEREKELADAKAEKQRILDENLNKFFKQKATTKARITSNETSIKANIRPDDVVVVPAEFYRLYNNAAGASVARSEGSAFVPEGEPGAVGATVTLDATAFTQVVSRNAERYNELAEQCSTLQDIVEQWENANDHDPS